VTRGRPTLSALVVCGNEAHNIADCLESVAWCDEIVVVDSFSTDGTLEIARRYTGRVFQRAWPGFIEQKQFALEQATGDWVLNLDADERCTDALREAILAALGSADAQGVAGFEVRRHVFYLGRWIDHGGWYPDWKLRVACRDRARFTGVEPHDRFVADGPVRRLHADLVHFTYRDFAHQLRTVDRFSDVVAAQSRKEGRRFSMLDALLHPPAKFLECYVWKRGFLDGWPGFVIAMTTAFYVFARQVKLRELDAAERAAGAAPPP
jgi:glycosyltransferase involved in cell wall biosynthesis